LIPANRNLRKLPLSNY